LSSISRVIIGIVQPKRSGFIDLSLGGLFGLLRGYAIIVLLFSFINSNVDSRHWPKYLTSGTFLYVVQYGDKFINTVPKRIETLKELGA